MASCLLPHILIAGWQCILVLVTKSRNFYFYFIRLIEPKVVFQAIPIRVQLNMLDNRRLCAEGALSWRPPPLLEAKNGRFPVRYHQRCLRSVPAPAPKVAPPGGGATGGVSRPSSYIFDDSALKNGVYFYISRVPRLTFFLSST